MIRYCTPLIVFILFASPIRLQAQQDIDKAAIERELDNVARLWQDAYNRHDVKAVAMTYAEQCDVEHNFQKLPSRAAVEQATAEYFRQNPQVQTKLADIQRTILSPTAVVESGIWREWNHTQAGMAVTGGYVSTMVKANGKWQIVHERAFPNDNVFSAFFSNAIGGSWHEQSALSAVDTYQWVLSQKFIQFTSRLGDAKTLGMIGTDPRSGELTWWVFHNDGSVEVRKPVVDSPVPNQYSMSVTSDSSQTKIAMQITFQNDDEVQLVPKGQIHGVEFNTPMHWKRDKQIADHSWLYAKPPTEIPMSMSHLQALQGAKWISHEYDGALGTGGAQGRWILDGKFYMGSDSLNFSDNSSWSHLVVIGRDPETQQMNKGWEFCSDGAVSEFTLASDGKSLAGKSFGGMMGAVEFSGDFQLNAGILDYSARLNKVGESTSIPYRWIYRDAEPLK